MTIRLHGRWRQHSHSERAAFTLIEFLVVIAIIGVLVSLLLPSLSQVKIRTRDTQCLGNFKQVGLAFKYFVDDWDAYPPSNVAEFDPDLNRRVRKRVTPAVGGINPAPSPYSIQYPQATNRPLHRYQGDPRIFHCPMDKGHNGDLDWPRPIHLRDKPTSWETAGCSYLYNAALEGLADTNRSPPLLPFTLLPNSGSLAGKAETWVKQPDKFILMNEPPAVIRMQMISPRVGIPWWTQWHRNRGRTDFRDPGIAPPLFVSPVLFVDGHAAVHDFSQSVMTDPYYPYEETKDWIWYQPRN